jgi:oligopeptide transport system substrate-binding protein
MTGAFRRAIYRPTAVDPYRAQETEGIAVTKCLFTGLVQLGPDGRLAPGVASGWGCDESGTRWWFQVRHGTRFSNGEPVTAASFVRGWNRALDPAAATETAYHLAGVRGWAEVRDGTAPALAGVSAPDPGTLLVELTEPDTQFDRKTLQPIFSPVPAAAGAALNERYQARPVGNGPYRFDGPAEPGARWRLVRNESYFDTPPAVPELLIDVLDSPRAIEEEYAGFQAGGYDFARVPPGELAAARDRYGPGGGFLERDLAGMYYLIPFMHRPPMDSVAARRAVSCAIDRESLARREFHGARTPATALIPPYFAEVHQAGLGDPYTRFDPELARKLAGQAGLPPDSEIDFAYNTGAGHDAWVVALADQLTQVLGWRVRLLAMSAAGLVAHRTGPDASGLCRAAWVCDYPTPDNILYPLLHSACTAPDAAGVAHGDNEGRYANPRFDELVMRARATPSPPQRVRLWQQAERIAVAEDLALIPLWYGTVHAVSAADRFTGVDLDFFGNPTVTTAAPVAGTGH